MTPNINAIALLDMSTASLLLDWLEGGTVDPGGALVEVDDGLAPVVVYVIRRETSKYALSYFGDPGPTTLSS
jgi:hypothetical protein